MSLMTVKNISKTYVDESGYRVKLYENVSLEINDNEIVSIIAPTGSGKSSIIKSLAKIEALDEGEISCDSKTVYIPSEPASFPWFSVKENIKYANKKISDEKLSEIIALIGLEGYENHIPDNKSFGFRFRISIGRALAIEPKVILLDEPFNKIDEKYRIELYDMVLNIKNKLDISILIATTNVTEAIYLSDRIYLLSRHPGTVFDEITVDYKPEREREFLFDSKLKELRDLIENKFHDKSLNIISDFNI